MRESEKLQLESLRKSCGLSVAEMARITGSSRNTIYALERGESVRRSTVIAILQAMSSNHLCSPVRSEIRNELRRLNIKDPDVSRVELLFEQLRGLKQHMERLDELGGLAPKITELKSFEEECGALSRAIDGVIRQQRSRK